MKNFLLKVPGLNANAKWKRILSIIIHCFLLLLFVGGGFDGITLMDKLLQACEFLVIIGIPYVLITNVGNIRRRMPLFSKEKHKYTVFGIILTSFIMGAFITGLETLKSPQQKQVTKERQLQTQLESSKKKEAAEKVKAEAKAKAEQKVKDATDAKATADAEQKVKDDADAKAKADTEQKSKDDANAKAKADAEQKAKDDADAMAAANAKQKTKDDADEKVNAEVKTKETAGTGSNSSSANNINSVAIGCAKSLILDNLKSPATAKWISSEVIETDSYGRYLILLTLDSENSFSALIRSKYYVVLQSVTSDGHYSFNKSFGLQEVSDKFEQQEDIIKNLNNWGKEPQK